MSLWLVSFAKKGTSILGFNLQDNMNSNEFDEVSLQLACSLVVVVGRRVVVVTFYRLIISSIVKPSGFLFMMPV